MNVPEQQTETSVEAEHPAMSDSQDNSSSANPSMSASEQTTYERPSLKITGWKDSSTPPVLAFIIIAIQIILMLSTISVFVWKSLDAQRNPSLPPVDPQEQSR